MMNIMIQIISLSRVNKFITKNKWTRALLNLLLLALAILNANNIFLKLLFSWGSPARKMTSKSRNYNEWINTENYCLHDIFDK